MFQNSKVLKIGHEQKMFAKIDIFKWQKYSGRVNDFPIDSLIWKTDLLKVSDVINWNNFNKKRPVGTNN